MSKIHSAPHNRAIALRAEATLAIRQASLATGARSSKILRKYAAELEALAKDLDFGAGVPE